MIESDPHSNQFDPCSIIPVAFPRVGDFEIEKNEVGSTRVRPDLLESDPISSIGFQYKNPENEKTHYEVWPDLQESWPHSYTKNVQKTIFQAETSPNFAQTSDTSHNDVPEVELKPILVKPCYENLKTNPTHPVIVNSSLEGNQTDLNDANLLREWEMHLKTLEYTIEKLKRINTLSQNSGKPPLFLHLIPLFSNREHHRWHCELSLSLFSLLSIISACSIAIRVLQLNKRDGEIRLQLSTFILGVGVE